jgi:O-antigen/teichoic acid export membrane protein
MGRKLFRSDFVLKVSQTFASKLFIAGVNIVGSILISRALGPNGKGIFEAAGALTAVSIQLGNLGLHSSNIYCVAQNRSLLPTLIGNSLVAGFGMGCLLISLFGLLFSIKPELAPVHGALLLWSLIAVPLGITAWLLQNLILGMYEIRVYISLEIAPKLLGLLLIIFAIFSTAVSIELFLAISVVIYLGIICVTLRELAKRITTNVKASWSLLKVNLSYGIRAYWKSLFTFLVLQVDILLVQYLLGPEKLGYYSLAASIANMVYMLPTVVGDVLFPRLSAMTSDSEKWAFARKTALLVMLVCIGSCTGAILVAQPAIRLFYGEVFLPAWPAFVGLMPAVILMSVSTIYNNYFAAIGLPLVTVFSPAIALVINILANLLLLPRIGILGASIASIFAYGSMFTFSVIYAHYLHARKS